MGPKEIPATFLLAHFSIDLGFFFIKIPFQSPLEQNKESIEEG